MDKYGTAQAPSCVGARPNPTRSIFPPFALMLSLKKHRRVSETQQKSHLAVAFA